MNWEAKYFFPPPSQVAAILHLSTENDIEVDRGFGDEQSQLTNSNIFLTVKKICGPTHLNIVFWLIFCLWDMN